MSAICIGLPVTARVGSDSYGGWICQIHRNGKTLYIGYEHWSKQGLIEEEYHQLSAEDRMEDKYQMLKAYTLRKNGKYVRKGFNARGPYLKIGEYKNYLDPHF